jgi:hypothetical protein
MKIKFALLAVILFCLPLVMKSQEEANYDENKVPTFTLPDPLRFDNGKPVRTFRQWEKKRRPQLLHLFESQVYGKIPAELKITAYNVLEEGTVTPYPNARRKQVEMVVRKGNRELKVQMLIYLPNNKEKVPLFLSYNFTGNHSINTDEKVLISKTWLRENPVKGETNDQSSLPLRGVQKSRWPIGMILDAGYGVATIYYGDVDPDKNDFSDGIHPFLYKKEQTRPGDAEWGSLAAWAWGLSRALDYFENDPAVDAKKVIVLGHSRLGKAALWAGATDTRFALVISNESGCGGAALSRRKFGETVKRINTSFPHWFCENFKAYNNKEENLPVDQHELIALIAPRPVYIASALGDQWADPKGEYLSGYYATPVYSLYGKKGLTSSEPPAVHQPVMTQIGYHIREGKHDVTDYDWQQFINFADRFLGN